MCVVCVRPRPGGGASVPAQPVAAGAQPAAVRALQAAAARRQEPPAPAASHQRRHTGGAGRRHGNPAAAAAAILTRDPSIPAGGKLFDWWDSMGCKM